MYYEHSSQYVLPGGYSLNHSVSSLSSVFCCCGPTLTGWNWSCASSPSSPSACCMLCYVVSDLDSPFSGFFRVDLSVLSFVLQKLESMYLESLMEEVESTLSGGIVKVTEIPSEKPGIKKMNDMKRKVWYKEKSFV